MSSSRLDEFGLGRFGSLSWKRDTRRLANRAVCALFALPSCKNLKKNVIPKMIFRVYARATIKWLLVLLPIAQRCMDFDTAIVGTEFTKSTFYELFSTATPANRAQRGDFRHYMKVRFTTARRIRFLLTLSIAKSSELY